MTSVFIRYNPQNKLRYHLAMACLERWAMEPEADIVLCVDKNCPYFPHTDLSHWRRMFLPSEYFWIEAKKYAEEWTQSNIYVVADDDQLLLGTNWIKKGVEVLEDNEEYGMVAAWSKNEEHKFNSMDSPTSEINDLTNFSIGCPYFIKKGTIKKFAEAPIMKQDSVLSQHIREQGLKLGFVKCLRYNHLGTGFSTADKNHWLA